MTPRTLATLIVRADRAWCKENADEQRPRDWAQQLAAVIDREALTPLQARIDQLEQWCSCRKPGWPT